MTSTIHIQLGSKSEYMQLPSFAELHAYVHPDVMCSLDVFRIAVAATEKILIKYKPSGQQIADVSAHMNVDLTDLSDLDWTRDHTLTVHLQRYALCGQHMINSTIREFIIADDFLTKYLDALEAGRDGSEYLYAIMGAMCRPALSGDLTDPRIKLSSKEQAMHYGSIFKSAARALLYRQKIKRTAMICLYTLIATKNFISKNYMPFLSGEGEAPAVSFGWHTIVMDIAENGAFGNISQVYDKSLHDIMIFCVKKIVDHKKQKPE